MKKGKTKIGFVFNLDEHWKDGSHWVALFVDTRTKQIVYFDSAGDDIPEEIEILTNRIQQQGKTLGIDLVFDKNHPFEHQMEDTECGIYCIYFITSMIKKPDFSLFKKKQITDKEMENYRRIYFSL